MPDDRRKREFLTVTDADSEHDMLAGYLPVPGQAWGKYLIEKLLGSGGQATVFQAFDRMGPAGHVALKLPKTPVPASRVEMWTQNEVEPLGKLDHPNIVRILDGGEVDGIPYLATELIEGESLGDYIRKSPPSDGRILDWMIQLTGAVNHAHSRGVTHRDLKPGNIIIPMDNSRDSSSPTRPRIIDFGISLLATPFRDTSQSGRSCTPQYAAPEQVLGNPDADHRVDVFALGGILKFLLEGSGPYGEVKDVKECMEAAKNGRVEQADDNIGSRMHRALARVANRALTVDPGQRYRNTGEMLKALRFIRNRRKFAVAAVCTVILITGLVLGVMSMPWGGTSKPNAIDTSLGIRGTSEHGAIRTSLDIHCQRSEQEGSYQVLSPDLLPLKTEDRVQIHVKFSEPMSACLLAVDPDGTVSVLYPASGDPSEPTRQIAIPGGRNEWLKLVDPGGVETVVLLARHEAITDLETLKNQVQSLSPAPAMDRPGLLIANGSGVHFIESKAKAQRRFDEKPVMVEKGFLAALAEMRGDEWVVVRAVSFPYTSEKNRLPATKDEPQ